MPLNKSFVSFDVAAPSHAWHRSCHIQHMNDSGVSLRHNFLGLDVTVTLFGALGIIRMNSRECE
jgi:hypothetical protein